MSRIWFASELEAVATFWQLLRRDGIALGFTTHDHDLWFGGLLHRATPGMVPSSIRRSADFEPDSAEVHGALTHEAISASDLAEGRFDGAQVRIGLVDWETGEHEILYRGAIGNVTEEDSRFTAELVSRKADLLLDPVPRTSPACRAVFCGPGCNLNGVAYTHEATVAAIDFDANALMLDTAAAPGDLVGGLLRWLEGPHAGTAMRILAEAAGGLVLDTPLDGSLAAGLGVVVREGCDHTLDTCATRFANALNFQGEPFLPGNDLLTRYPTPVQ
ncbi:MAG: DUF2163 domain-containing protein [Novosphingobium sp.]|nr:DUF2163 domain-containing protein [Novosphingobium sp.]